MSRKAPTGIFTDPPLTTNCVARLPSLLSIGHRSWAFPHPLFSAAPRTTTINSLFININVCAPFRLPLSACDPTQIFRSIARSRVSRLALCAGFLRVRLATGCTRRRIDHRIAGGPYLNLPQKLGGPGLDFQTWRVAQV